MTVTGASVSTVQGPVGRTGVGVTQSVGRAHAERVLVLGQFGVLLGRRAAREFGGVEAALEGDRASLEEKVNVAEVLGKRQWGQRRTSFRVRSCRQGSRWRRAGPQGPRPHERRSGHRRCCSS